MIENAERKKYKYDFKPAFKERMLKLLPDSEDFSKFESIIHTHPKNFIRCNTLKISPESLIKILEKKWTVVQPFPDHKELILIDQNLMPGELGSSLEHLSGYYYIQEISSMMSAIALDPKPQEFIIDLCSSPGSKATQIASLMENSGTLIANDLKFDRISILSSNMERCGVTNFIITKNDSIALCSRLAKSDFRFDRVLLDAPCSGEGTLRSSPKTFLMWNEKMIHKLSRQQKKLLAFALKTLKVGGTLVYSTCTHAPEENEEVVDFAVKNFPIRVESFKLPLKTRPGITKWEDMEYSQEVSKCQRIYPQDNDSEGFFVSKMTLMEEIKN
ncbi:MAG: RsmB/NOP family class I SAM-dependent RNA methyltransferase [Nanoarchaeota archaeon]|nr:RsmB/NOP family class I SAM-dependent RNA methyltransferase [Nanoarchaeota archaeon]